jgi:putative membrane protein
MTATQSDLAGLSRYIFTAPSWYASLGFALAIAAMAGIAAFDSGTTDPTWRNLLILGRDAWQGIFFIGLPTIIASVGTTGVDRIVGGKLTPNRSSLLALLCELILVAIVIGAGIVSLVTPLGQTFVYDALVIALASIFAFRLLVVMAVSQSSLLIAAIPASLQTLVSAIFLFVYSGTVRFLEFGGPLVDAYLMPYLSRASEAPPELWIIDAHHFQLLVVTCVVYAGGVYAFVRVIDRPWQRSLGVSVLDFIRGFVGHVAEGSRELEDFFEKLGEEAVVPVTVLAFQRSDGTQKARFVLPMIHPGPMGEIGGGNFPVRVAEHTDGLVFPPHATAGHDFNLVTEREVDSILDAIDDAQAKLTYSDEATRSVRTQSGEASMLGQRFGGDALLVATYAPGFADDVEYGVGLTAAAEARTVGIDDTLLVDAHNSNNGLQGEDLGHVTPGSQRAFDMITAAKRTGQRLSEAPTGPVKLGVAWERTDWDALDGIGPLGIRVAVVEVDGQYTAYVLVDGNNMVPGLRKRVVDAVTARGPVTVAEVMTTDTHIVNTVEADNQVGAAIDHGEFVSTIERLVDAAVDDLEPVSAGLATERATVTVFGNDRTETLASHANAVVSMGGALAAVIILGAMAVSVLIFFLTG